MELRLVHGQQSIPEMVTSLTCKPGHWRTPRFSCRRTRKDSEWFPERNCCKTYYTGYSCPGVLWAVSCNCVIDCKWYKQSFNQQHDTGSLLSSHSSSPTSGLLPLRGLSALSTPTTLVFKLCWVCGAPSTTAGSVWKHPAQPSQAYDKQGAENPPNTYFCLLVHFEKVTLFTYYFTSSSTDVASNIFNKNLVADKWRCGFGYKSNFNKTSYSFVILKLNMLSPQVIP